MVTTYAMDHFNTTTWALREEAFAQTFLKESWGLYGLAILAIVFRFISRIRKFGVLGLKIDDALMFLATASYTMMIFGMNFVLLRGAESNFMPAIAAQYLSAAQVAKIVQNGKWYFVNEHMLIITLWCAKFGMLVIYFRLTDGLQARRWIIGLTAYVTAAFVGTELGLWFSCFPVSRRWDVPSQDLNCSFYEHYQIVETILSISSTILILAVGLPIVTRIRLPLRQKWIVTILFGLGLFDVAAAILTKIYVLNVQLYGFEFFIWYVREATVALLVCNLPFVWSLVGEFFPALKAWAGKNDLESMPRFWRERKRTCHLFRHFGRRKRSTTYGMPSFIEMKDTDYFDAKRLESVQTECVADLDPVARKLSAKYESADIGRMASCELEDAIHTIDKVAKRKVFGDSERELAVPLSSLNPPGFRGALRVDSVAEGMNAIRGDQGDDDGKHCSCCSKHVYDDKHEL